MNTSSWYSLEFKNRKKVFLDFQNIYECSKYSLQGKRGLVLSMICHTPPFLVFPVSGASDQIWCRERYEYHNMSGVWVIHRSNLAAEPWLTSRQASPAGEKNGARISRYPHE